MGKAFLGGWIDEDVRKRLKIVCVVHGVAQQDVIEQLIINFVKSERLKEDIKNLMDGR